ncbi:MAG: PIN domain-containing protein [Acidithiobacillus sp.]
MTGGQLQFSIRSESLSEFRNIGEIFTGGNIGELLQKAMGPLAQFTVVVDANVILGDLKFLATREKPEAITALMECVRAGTFIAYATRNIVSEVERHIPKLVKQYNDSEGHFLRHWAEYKKMLKIKTPRKYRVEKNLRTKPQDPDDAPTIALAKELKAVGIFTKDSDLEAMGGFCLDLDFAIHARDYSRKIVVAATIEQGAFTGLVVGGYAVVGLSSALAGSCRSFFNVASRAPAWVKIGAGGVTLGLFLWVILNGEKRGQVLSGASRVLAKISGAVSDGVPVLLQVASDLNDIVREHDVLPPMPTRKLPK